MGESYAVNARFVTQPLTGVQRYCYELSKHLRAGIFFSPRPVLADYPRLQGRVRITGGYLAGHPWEQFALPLSIGRRQALLSPAGCGPLGHPNQVIVVHDIAVLENPEWYSRSYSLWYSQLYPALARRVRKIVTVSQFCKERIIELLGIPERKVVVALEAASSSFFPRPPAEIAKTSDRLAVRAPYFLAIGAVSPRKNFERLMAAWIRAREQLNGVQLVLIGKEGLRFSGGSSLHGLPEGVTHLGSVEDEVLAGLYSGAQGLLYPSLYEGFGLPILEAMACGCPVLTSNCTAMPEVAGNAAILVDPLSEESIAEGVIQLAQKDRSAELRSRGLQRCRQFSWTKTAEVAETALLN